MSAFDTLRPRPAAGAPSGSFLERQLPSLHKVNRMELMVFSRQMATFMRAGIPILDGIKVIQDEATSGLFRRTLAVVAQDLQAGEPLSAALARHPRVFPPVYVDLVVAAEATGELDVILEQLARYIERGEATARKVRQAMLYPLLVLGLACVVIFILSTFVLPNFVALFEDFHAELPLPTQVLLAVGAFGGRFGVLLGAGLLFGGILLYLGRNSGPLRRLRDRLLLRLPLLGGLARLGIQARFARTFAILLRAGVPIVQAFDIVVTGTNNSVYRQRLAPARERLIAGDGIAGPLAASGLLSPLLLQMIKVGEQTGTLDRYLEQAADFLDDDLEYRTRQMITVIEPVMIIGIAIMVGFVALSVITPLYGILHQIR